MRSAGVSEIVKYGLIRDAQLFEWLEANMGKLLARDPAAVAHAVEQSCINKVGLVDLGRGWFLLYGSTECAQKAAF